MNDAQIIQSVILLLIGVAGFFMRKTLSDLENKAKQHDEDIKKIQREYLHRDDFKEFKAELKTMFEEIKHDIRSLRGKGE